jgi:hypothetical protein
MITNISKQSTEKVIQYKLINNRNYILSRNELPQNQNIYVSNSSISDAFIKKYDVYIFRARHYCLICAN